MEFIVWITILTVMVWMAAGDVWPKRIDHLSNREFSAFTGIIVLIFLHIVAHTLAANPIAGFVIQTGAVFVLAGLILSKIDLLSSKLAVLDAKIQGLGEKVEKRDKLVDYEK